MTRVIAMTILAAILTTAATSAAERLPIPTPDANAVALKRIREIFKTDYTNTTASGRSALAEKLLKSATETAEPAEQYGLLSEARDVSAGAGDARTAIMAAQKLDALFDERPAAAELAAFAALKKVSLSAAAASDATFSVIASIDIALAAGDMDTAAKLATAGDAIAGHVTDPELAAAVRQRIADVRSAMSESGRLAADRKVLKERPGDPRASLNVGKFLCFTLGRWDEGLACLVNASDPKFYEPAVLERTNPTDAKTAAKIADGWYACAESLHGLAHGHAVERAVEWYRKAIPGLTGLEKLRAEKRVATAVATIRSWDSMPYRTVEDGTGVTLGMIDRNVTRSFLIQFEVNTTCTKSACLLTKRHQEGDGSLTVLLRSQGAIEINGDASFYRSELKGRTVVNDGQWHTVRIEKQGPTVKLFVDNASEGSMETQEEFKSSSPWVLGWHQTWNRPGPDALFRHVRIEGGN